eukprot:GDKK01078998.1.p1 GENE.GDKK01078998.1~~GDKK01078998.1.p1  ORF type:complete len:377 (-),score=66.72 GDKK01078998.1:23-1123(-)
MNEKTQFMIQLNAGLEQQAKNDSEVFDDLFLQKITATKPGALFSDKTPCNEAEEFEIELPSDNEELEKNANKSETLDASSCPPSTNGEYARLQTSLNLLEALLIPPNLSDMKSILKAQGGVAPVFFSSSFNQGIKGDVLSKNPSFAGSGDPSNPFFPGDTMCLPTFDCLVVVVGFTNTQLAVGCRDASRSPLLLPPMRRPLVSDGSAPPVVLVTSNNGTHPNLNSVKSFDERRWASFLCPPADNSIQNKTNTESDRGNSYNLTGNYGLNVGDVLKLTRIQRFSTFANCRPLAEANEPMLMKKRTDVDSGWEDAEGFCVNSKSRISRISPYICRQAYVLWQYVRKKAEMSSTLNQSRIPPLPPITVD